MTLLVRAVPVRKDGSRGPRVGARARHVEMGAVLRQPDRRGRELRRSMIVFYYTPAFELALTTYIGHLAMLLHFTLAGYLFANALVGIDPARAARMAAAAAPAVRDHGVPRVLRRRAHHGRGTPGARVVRAAGARLGHHGDRGPAARRWGRLGIGELPTLSLAIIVAVMWSKSDEREARRRDRRVDQVGDLEMDEYNKMLAEIAERDAKD
ncbi:cytochrome c oxidase assembly protein [Oerskovia sp. M15]